MQNQPDAAWVKKLKDGDSVFLTRCRRRPNGDSYRTTFFKVEVTKVTPQRVMLNGGTYIVRRETGELLSPHDKYALLKDTAETQAAYAAFQAEKKKEEAEREAANNRQIRVRKERAAAAALWLHTAASPALIIDTLFVQTLNDVYDELVKAGKVGEISCEAPESVPTRRQ